MLDELRTQGWIKLLGYNDGIYESEVKQFYENLVVSDDLVLSTVVNDVVITLTVTELAQVLEVPSSGFLELPYQTWPFC